MILRYDNKKINAFMKTNIEGIKKAKKINFDIEDLQNKDVRKNIIKKTKYYINELWKDENLIDISVPSYLVVNTKIKNSSSLDKIFNTIKNISLIDNYVVQELNNNSAKIKIKFLEKFKIYKTVLIANGIKFYNY